MDFLDSVVITILDSDRVLWGIPNNEVRERYAAVVWGPWEFNTHKFYASSDEVVSNRATKVPAVLAAGRQQPHAPGARH